MMGHCRFCGQQKEGISFYKWVKPTFTDLDKLLPGDVACYDCLFWFEEKSEELAIKMGKDKLQRMRNYSHFIINDKWTPLSKGDKARMIDILTTPPFPELAAIAESGQKHIVFRATRNPQGGKAGWVQFEEQSLWVEPEELKEALNIIVALMDGFSKSQIETGEYNSQYIIQFGFAEWRELEEQIKSVRGTLLFKLAVFLAQKQDKPTPKKEVVKVNNPPKTTEQLSLF